MTDPKTPSAPAFLKGTARMLNDARDTSVVWLMLQCALVVAVGISLFFWPYAVGVSVWYLAPLYYGLIALTVMDRFTLMLHFTSHRQLFNKDWKSLNHVIPWLLGPFFGQTPNTYFAHHMGMHHREENLADDLSSTMRFTRNRITHWLRYYLRFLLFGLPELLFYFYKRDNWKLFQRVLVGEGVYWTVVALGLWLRPEATWVVLIMPLVAMRTIMMMGNWVQHSFISQDHPEDPYQSSITCINTRYNRRCFNDGYHILHHIKPRAHWTEHPIEFENALAEYAAHDAIVFEGVDYFQIWLYMMLGQWGGLADKFVHLQGAPVRSKEDVIAFLKSRVQPVTLQPVTVPPVTARAGA
ncbi:MAG TPA: fatty acid desaturase [Polyangiaceae bacterium]|nr:fatty acid desaturase [Polyangiaceae bacterium]